MADREVSVKITVDTSEFLAKIEEAKQAVRELRDLENGDA